MSGSRVHVVAAAIFNRAGDVLIARRGAHQHQGGLWEFPGGKLEKDESRWDGLRREIQEELDIAITKGRPLISIRHDYSDKSVLLDVWRVEEWEGKEHGKEGQPLQWVKIGDLSSYDFPAANRPIIKALQLPDRYFITPEPHRKSDFLSLVEKVLSTGVTMMQLRCKTLSYSAYVELSRDVLAICRRYGARLLLNSEMRALHDVDADGVHLTAERLLKMESNGLPGKLVAASVHNIHELRHACALDLDFVVAGSVLPTLSHPGDRGMGWQAFQKLTETSTIPVYALGGLTFADLETAFAEGAQGIAAIRAFADHFDANGNDLK